MQKNCCAPAITKPSRSLSKGLEAVAGAALRFVDNAPMQSNIAVNLKKEGIKARTQS